MDEKNMRERMKNVERRRKMLWKEENLSRKERKLDEKLEDKAGNRKIQEQIYKDRRENGSWKKGRGGDGKHYWKRRCCWKEWDKDGRENKKNKKEAVIGGKVSYMGKITCEEKNKERKIERGIE